MGHGDGGPLAFVSDTMAEILKRGNQMVERKKGDKPGKKESAPQSAAPEFTSDLAMEIVGELYPLLLENCTDEDGEIDTTAVVETLAALLGLFASDYHEQFGQDKAMGMVKEMVDLAMGLYQERVSED